MLQNFIILIKFVIVILFSSQCYSQISDQPTYNLDFEGSKFSHFLLPRGWFTWGKGYKFSIDTLNKFAGNQSALIQSDPNWTKEYSGSMVYSLTVNTPGKELILRSHMMFQNVTNGYIGMLLRLDGVKGKLVSEDLLDKKIEGSAEWKEYEIKLSLPNNVRTIYFGGLLTGTGKLWIDNFELLIDGRNIQNTEIGGVNYKAKFDGEFWYGSGINNIETSAETVSNLYFLAKVWGFLKYYHPLVRKGDFNWDNELFRILPVYLKLKNHEQCNEFMSDWITKLGEDSLAKQSINGFRKDEDIIEPDLTWINQKNLGSQLAQKLQAIKQETRNEKCYYVDLVDGVGNPFFINELGYFTPSYLDDGIKLLCLFRYWNIIEYFSPYKDVIDENWDIVLKEFIPKFCDTKNEIEYKLIVLEMISKVQDSHSTIIGFDNTLEKAKGINFAPLKVSFIENKAIVTGFYHDSVTKIYGITLGDELKTINGKSVDSIVKYWKPLTPASNSVTMLRDIAFGLLRSNDTTMFIEYSRDHLTSITQLHCHRLNEYSKELRKRSKDTCFKILGSDISYLFPQNLKSGYLEKLLPIIAKTKGFIIDLRCYPSQFIVYSLGEFLLPHKKEFARVTSPDLANPGTFFRSKPLEVGKENPNFYKGKVMILVNELTQSQAEFTAMALRTSDNSKVIGSSTAGADGNVSDFILPGGIRTRISGIGVYYPNNKPTQRVGIIPDIFVSPTINGIKMGKDEVLDMAIDRINRQ